MHEAVTFGKVCPPDSFAHGLLADGRYQTKMAKTDCWARRAVQSVAALAVSREELDCELAAVCLVLDGSQTCRRAHIPHRISATLARYGMGRPQPRRVLVEYDALKHRTRRTSSRKGSIGSPQYITFPVSH
jgi:hypothetical protein